MIRKHLIFKGRVQGVGFRITFYQRAMREHLTGWVKNLSDGSVEACVQGENEAINQVIAHMKSIRYIQITSLDEEELPILESEKTFEMKY